ncbi:MAG: hydantoinase/oxoprolinase family protein [Chloroflexi bacterium]|nr:hydantoinase/oxoprolinase family protein [Chloroflexota bacterium]
MGARLGIDIGGTFTDLVLVRSDGTVVTEKVLSTPDDFGRAIVTGVRDLLQRTDVTVTDVVHGTTVCSNTILEGKGARTGLITTRGFRDALEIGRMRYPRLYDLTWSKPPPLVPRRRRREILERLDHTGNVVEPLDEASVERTLRLLLEDGIESLAICLLHSYANAAHEQRAREIAETLAPELPISLSCEVLPEIGEYERMSTTVINAYLQPVVGSYLANLSRSLGSINVHALVQVMQSNGGIMAASAASERPIHIVESGPAAGVIAAQHLAAECAISDVIALDMGGTTAKASIIEAGTLQRASEFEVAGGLNIGNRLNTGAGYRLRVPAIDIAEVGAGGGSLVSIDSAGALHVGPESAGAAPGPVCYGLGGEQPTLTDANLLIGYLNPSSLLGGSLSIDFGRAKAAFARSVAQPLGLDPLQAAYGVHQIAVANMVRAVKAISSERGRDPRQFACVAYGGNGPLHAVSAAAEIGISLVIVPPSPGLFSAFGLLTAEPSAHAARSLLRVTQTLTADTLEHAYQQLEREVLDSLVAQGYAPTQARLARTIDVHYAGQSFELSLAMPSPVDRAAVESIDVRFGAEHERTYGHRAGDDPVEVVHIRVQGRVPGRAVSTGRQVSAKTPPATAREAYFGARDGVLQTPVLNRAHVEATPRPGPLIVEEYDATTVVPPGWTIRRDDRDNLLIQRSQAT